MSILTDALSVYERGRTGGSFSLLEEEEYNEHRIPPNRFILRDYEVNSTLLL